MKRIAWSAFAVFFAVTLVGCALPEKKAVSVPTSQTYPSQPLPVYTPDSTVPKSLQTPGVLEIEAQPEVVIEEGIETTLPSMIFINDRIFEYGRKLERWKELDSQSVNIELGDEEAAQMVRCFRRLQTVMNGYSDLRSVILQSHEVVKVQAITNEEIFTLQKDDIAFVESSCGRLLSDSENKSVDWSQREEGSDLTQLETLIDRYAENNENEEIIQVWEKIPEFQHGRVHLRTKILYGNALMYLHQQEKAADIYLQVVNQMSDSDAQATDIVSLRKILADLYIASGNYKKATVQYKKISDDYTNLGRLEEWSKLQLSILDRSMDGSQELLEYSEMLRNFLGFVPGKDGYKVVWQAEKFLADYPYSPVSSNVDFIKEDAKKAADQWFNAFIEDVDKFGTEQKYEEALELLDTIPLDIVSPEQQLDIKAKSEELLLGEAVDRETDKMAKIQELQQQWNNGMLLAKEGKYDEAIAVFTNLLDTEYATKAERKITEITLEAAKADRKKAANLFIRFTKTTDIESKKKLLIESRKLLKDILVKYPEVEIAAKVLGNINRVEQEMNALDPNLLMYADQVEERSEVEVDGIEQAFTSPSSTVNEVPQPIIETEIEMPKYQ